MASSKAGKAAKAGKASKAGKPADKAKGKSQPASAKKGTGARIADLKGALFGKGKKAAAPASAMKKGSAPSKAPAPKASAPKAAASKVTAAPAKAGKAAAPLAAVATKAMKGAVAAVAAVVATPVVAKGKGKGKGKINKTGIVDYSRSLRSTGAIGISIGSENICREVACEGLATTGGYCRLHYIKNWRKIQRKAGILKEGKLNRYIEELVGKYPDKYLEAIRSDLVNDKEFAKVIYDLDLDEGVNDDVDADQENMDGVIDTVRGGGRDFDDEGEAF